MSTPGFCAALALLRQLGADRDREVAARAQRALTERGACHAMFDEGPFVT